MNFLDQKLSKHKKDVPQVLSTKSESGTRKLKVLHVCLLSVLFSSIFV